MAQGDIVVFNAFKRDILQGKHDLTTDAIRVTLHTGLTPNIDTQQVFADISATQYGTGDGYTANGKLLGSPGVTLDTVNDRALFNGDNVTWEALGPLTPATPSHAVIWNDTAANDPLIGAMELGSTATNGGDYTLAWSTSPAALVSVA